MQTEVKMQTFVYLTLEELHAALRASVAPELPEEGCLCWAFTRDEFGITRLRVGVGVECEE